MKDDLDFVSVNLLSQKRAFFVWNKRTEDFERRNGNARWESWEAFVADLSSDLSGRPELSERDKKRIISAYTSARPSHIQGLYAARKPESKVKNFVSMLFSVGILALVLAGVLYAVWSGFAKPLLGSMGLVDYKSKTQVRYEKFMESTVGCKEQKTVMSGNGSAKYPAFQLFVCPTGEEKIWSHKVEVVRKIANDKWVLE